MILTAHQPGYLPWLGLFHKIYLAEKFVSFNLVQFEIKGWHNRNKIKTSSGPVWLSVPVFTKNHLNSKMIDIEICADTPWQKKHFKTIKIAYSKSTHWNKYCDFFEDLYLNHRWENLVDLNQYMLKWFISTLQISCIFEDMRDYNFEGSKSNLVLDMCVKMGASSYIFGKQGVDYADCDSFRERDIDVYFQDYIHPKYNQVHGDFLENMSIIDLLFMYGNNSLEVILDNNIKKIG